MVRNLQTPDNFNITSFFTIIQSNIGFLTMNVTWHRKRYPKYEKNLPQKSFKGGVSNKVPNENNHSFSKTLML
jgi:hypothetical protein